MVDPRAAHHIDARLILGHTVRLSQSDLPEVRREFARYLTTPAARSHSTWQEAWNAWTGASPSRPGNIRYTPSRCHACNGKGFNHRNVGRNLSRTGNPYVCGECRGTRRGSQTNITARFITPPQPSAEPDASVSLDESHNAAEDSQ